MSVSGRPEQRLGWLGRDRQGYIVRDVCAFEVDGGIVLRCSCSSEQAWLSSKPAGAGMGKVCVFHNERPGGRWAVGVVRFVSAK